jgi:hypothetical protein
MNPAKGEDDIEKGGVRSKEAPMDEKERVPCGLAYMLKRVCCGWNRPNKRSWSERKKKHFAWVRLQLIADWKL